MWHSASVTWDSHPQPLPCCCCCCSNQFIFPSLKLVSWIWNSYSINVSVLFHKFFLTTQTWTWRRGLDITYPSKNTRETFVISFSFLYPNPNHVWLPFCFWRFCPGWLLLLSLCHRRPGTIPLLFRSNVVCKVTSYTDIYEWDLKLLARKIANLKLSVGGNSK